MSNKNTENNIHVIVDIGSSHVSVMAVEIQESGEVRILSEESIESNDVIYGVISQPSNAAFNINKLFRLLQNKTPLYNGQKACVSLNAKTMKEIPVQIVRSLNNNKAITDDLLEEMADECSEKFSQQPNVDIFDIIPVSYELDGERTDNPVGKKGNKLSASYNVIVGTIYIRDELKRCFARVTTLASEDFTPLAMEALSTVLLDDEERESGCALINFGATTTTLAIYAEGVLQKLLVVPLGGKNITHDIQELGISEKNAERLKQLKGSALESLVTEPISIKITSVEPNSEPVIIKTDFLATIIEARLTELMTPIFRELRETPFELNAGIVISGGGANLNNIIDFLEAKTRMEARFGNHSDWLSEDNDKRFYNPIYAQSIGTALLLHDYLEETASKEAAATPQKNQNKKVRTDNSTKKFIDKVADKLLNLFEDENYLK
ncbi:cell division protein FtsA [Paludibacter sp. 221]|uniref:cell division protein FtsA n=1 Tax=Paludibacter sp. 221 TaxID=2302939 RepID=UPI0013D3FF0B|nr:cell division protein FtsA [Paludibacter sp. 221]NDV47565.1 cell division protein FtsA [Paludibacter sp. 221]